MKSRNNIPIIVVSIITVVVIIAAIIAYLFIATDIFKSDKELFLKYIVQNIDIINELKDSSTVNDYKNLKNQNAYDSLTTVNFMHSDGGEISNPINDLSVQISTQKNQENEYFYADAQLLFQDEEYLEAELIRDNELAGIRFTDVIKQFITIRDDENLEVVAEVLEVDVEQLKEFINVMYGTSSYNEIISAEESTQLKEKYTNIITNTISQANFSSVKKASVTVNAKTIEVNAFNAQISKELVMKMIIEILNTVKTDEIILSKTSNFIDESTLIDKIDELIENISQDFDIPEINITVYEEKKVVVQTKIEIGENKILIENVQNENDVNMKIIFQIDDEEINEKTINIIKNNNENSEKYAITLNSQIGENISSIDIVTQTEKQTDKLKFNISAEYTEDSIVIGVHLENDITINGDVENRYILDESNNVVLNEISKTMLINRMEFLSGKVGTKTTEKIEELQEKMAIQDDSLFDDETASQIEVNKFNAQFEFYTGEEVSAENIKSLMELVKNNLSEIEYFTNEETNVEENGEFQLQPDEELLKIKLKIEKDKENVDIVNSMLENINENSKYEVSIVYKEDNGIVDYIMVEELKKE